MHRDFVSRDEWLNWRSTSLRRAVQTLSLTVLLALCIPAPAQGCSQCREAVGQTPARTQTAYRRGVLVLVLAGATAFTSGLVAIRRFR